MFDALIAGMQGGTPARILVKGQDTGGEMAAVELYLRRGMPLPRHIHANEDELIFVLDGHLTCDTGERETTVRTGESIFLPRGSEHAFRVESDEARLLVIMTPAGLECCCDEFAPTETPGIERLVATAARYGVAITGPGR